MPLTGGRIVDSLNQAQGVILETLKEREKDRAEERKEELSAGGLAPPVQGQPGLSACSQPG